MHPGDLRWRARLLERRLLAAKASGFVPTEWDEWAEEWCQIIESGATESVGHKSRGGTAGIVVVLRAELPRFPKLTDAVELLDGTNRVVFVKGARYLDPQRRWIELTCGIGL